MCAGAGARVYLHVPVSASASARVSVSTRTPRLCRVSLSGIGTRHGPNTAQRPGSESPIGESDGGTRTRSPLSDAGVPSQDQVRRPDVELRGTSGTSPTRASAAPKRRNREPCEPTVTTQTPRCGRQRAGRRAARNVRRGASVSVGLLVERMIIMLVDHRSGLVDAASSARVKHLTRRRLGWQSKSHPLRLFSVSGCSFARSRLSESASGTWASQRNPAYAIFQASFMQDPDMFANLQCFA